MPGPGADELLGRCTFPEVGTPVVGGVRAGPFSRSSVSGRPRRPVRDRGPRGPRAAPRVGPRSRDRGRGRRPLRSRLHRRPDTGGRRREPRGPGPPGPADGPRTSRGHRPHHGQPGRDRPAQPPAGRRGRRLDGLWPTAPLTRFSGLRRSETRALCEALGLAPVRDPSNDDPRFREPCPPRTASAVLGHGRRAWCPCSPGKRDCCGTKELCSTGCRPGHPGDSAAPAAAPGPLARRATRRWLRADGPHPPDLAAVVGVLGWPGARPRPPTRLRQEVRRSKGRLSVAPATVPVALTETGARGGPGDPVVLDLSLVVSRPNGRRGGVALARRRTTDAGQRGPLAPHPHLVAVVVARSSSTPGRPTSARS